MSKESYRLHQSRVVLAAIYRRSKLGPPREHPKVLLDHFTRNRDGLRDIQDARDLKELLL